MTIKTIMAPALFAAAAIGAQAACASESEPEHVWSADERAVIDALSAGPIGLENDFEGWSAGYHPEWSHWRVGAPSARDRETHMGLVRDFVEEGGRVVAYDFQPVDVILRGDVALIRFNAVETIVDSSGETREARYSSASMMVREDGRWLTLASNLTYPPAE